MELVGPSRVVAVLLCDQRRASAAETLGCVPACLGTLRSSARSGSAAPCAPGSTAARSSSPRSGAPRPSSDAATTCFASSAMRLASSPGAGGEGEQRPDDREAQSRPAQPRRHVIVFVAHGSVLRRRGERRKARGGRRIDGRKRARRERVDARRSWLIRSPRVADESVAAWEKPYFTAEIPQNRHLLRGAAVMRHLSENVIHRAPTPS